MVNIKENTNNNKDLFAHALLGVLSMLRKGVLALTLALLALLEQADANVVGDDLANNSNMNNNC